MASAQDKREAQCHYISAQHVFLLWKADLQLACQWQAIQRQRNNLWERMQYVEVEHWQYSIPLKLARSKVMAGT
ncbi:UPF0746 protein [Trichinella pseudospiralis]